MDYTSGTINHAEVVPLRNIKPFLVRAFMVDEDSGIEILTSEEPDEEDNVPWEAVLNGEVKYDS